jgi:putative transposase
VRFTLSYRDVADLLAERGLDISYETVRSWVLKFGPVIARRLRRRRPRPSEKKQKPELPKTNWAFGSVEWEAVAEHGGPRNTGDDLNSNL